MGSTNEDVAEFRGGLDRPLGGGSGHARVTQVCQRLRRYRAVRATPESPS